MVRFNKYRRGHISAGADPAEPVTAAEPPCREPRVAAAEQPVLVSVGLGLLALIAAGGLIPFWMWIYFVYNPPIK
jgi:hypothetical protein